MMKTKYTKPTISILQLEKICLSSASGEIDDDYLSKEQNELYFDDDKKLPHFSLWDN